MGKLKGLQSFSIIFAENTKFRGNEVWQEK